MTFAITPDDRRARSTSWSSLGDVRIEGIYTGFFDDMSAGVTLGLKLPTGNDTHDMNTILDRDTELGTGSTDLLLGGFYRHTLDSVTPGLFWFAQAELDIPTLIQGGYRPGVEIDTALGVLLPEAKVRQTGHYASSASHSQRAYTATLVTGLPGA